MRLINNIAAAAVLAFGVISAAHATYTATHIAPVDGGTPPRAPRKCRNRPPC